MFGWLVVARQLNVSTKTLSELWIQDCIKQLQPCQLLSRLRRVRGMVAVGMLKTIEKIGSPCKTRICDIWINSPPSQPQLIQINTYKIV
ncbi:uncharacterized protein METZ01_LOCUS150275 [marine metagenome]|uniref:Uncharacterized protein n=1 Tax=marine metagenome TaxID=408172 RepID=A0A382A868_9ZZZZ